MVRCRVGFIETLLSSMKPVVLGDRQPAKKRERVTPGAISAFFGSTNAYKNNNEH